MKKFIKNHPDASFLILMSLALILLFVLLIGALMVFVVGPQQKEITVECQSQGGHVRWLSKGDHLCIDQDGRIIE